MPELPEVETIVKDLAPVLKGAKFSGIEIFNKNTVVGKVADFAVIFGRKVSSVERRGKFIIIFFDNDYVVTVHLRMTGRLLVSAEGNLKYERARMTFGKTILHYCDMRKFGRIWLNKKSEFEKETGIAKLGLEPLDKSFTFKRFLELVKGKKGIVKNFLLDQSQITGIGNIYADESCFYAVITPNSRLENLSKKDLENLFLGIKKALTQGVKNRGTSVSDFIDTKGKKGKNQELLFVYKRAGKDCLVCGTKLHKTKTAGRTTVFCLSCQKKK